MGGTAISLCNKETLDLSTVQLTGESGDSFLFFVTDNQGEIIDIQTSTIFNFGQLATGNYLLWHISMGVNAPLVMIGDNVSELVGCFGISNSLSIDFIDTSICLNNSIICSDITMEINEDQVVEIHTDSIAELLGCNAILSFSDTNIISNFIFDCQDIGTLSITVFSVDLINNCDGSQDTVFTNLNCTSFLTVIDPNDFCATGGAVSDQDKNQNPPKNH
jgi:hypothetical protein